MTDDKFGFGKPAGQGPSTLAKLATIRPADQPPTSNEDLRAVDAAAERHGFVSRAGRQPRGRRKTLGVTISISIRAPEEVAERFFEFCEQNRFAYWEGIAELMDRAKIALES